MSKVIASLSDLGWVENSETVLSKLLGYYILTDAAQSVIFQNNLINLPETYFLYIKNPSGVAVRVREDLDKLLSRYFPIVEVETEAVAKTESVFGILIYASVIDEKGIKVNLGKVATLNSTGVTDVININNYGDGLQHLRAG